MGWALRILIASILFGTGVALLVSFQKAAFIAHDSRAIVWVALGALLNSIAIAFLTWPKITRRRIRSGPSNRELAARLDQIH